MLNLERVLNEDRLLRAMTGLTRKAGDARLPSFEGEVSRDALKPVGQRASGGGRKAPLKSIEATLWDMQWHCPNASDAALKRLWRCFL
jgi:hypothetical protein